jgi:chemotaxis signal transduction protein
VSRDEGRTMKSADAMRSEFDRAFATATAATDTQTHDFLAVRAGGDPYALRLADVAALHRDRKIVRLPNRSVELLGIAGFRGVMAPVYDLGALLGYPASTPTWLVITRGRSPVGLAFEEFEAHVRVTEDGMSSVDKGKGARHHVRGAVRAHNALRPLIHIASILEAIAARVQADAPSKEH